MNKIQRFSGTILVLMVMFSIAVPNDVMATPTINYYFVKSWGGEADQFLYPQDVAWGENGEFFVANRNLHRITGVSARDNTYWTWGYQGYAYPLEFQHPSGVAVDGNGNVFSVDGNWNISKTTKDGQFITSWYLQGAYSIDTLASLSMV